MKSSKIIVLSALAAAAAALVAYEWWSQADEGRVKVLAHSQPKPMPPAAVATTAEASKESSPVKEPTRASRLTERSERYFAATDLKQFVDQAKANPAGGSYYMATLALRECDRAASLVLASTADGNTRDLPQRRASIERIGKRCAFAKSMAPSTLRALGDEGLKNNDASFSVLAPVSSKVIGESGESGKGLDRALFSPSSDAAMLVDVTRELAVQADNLLYEGREPTDIERSSLPAAILLAGCRLGVPCDSTHWLVELACVGQGRCYSSLDQLLQEAGSEYSNNFIRTTRYSYATAQEMAARIADNAARGQQGLISYRR